MTERYEDPMHRLTLEMMERLVNAAEEIGIQLSRMNDISEPPKIRKTVPIQGTP